MCTCLLIAYPSTRFEGDITTVISVFNDAKIGSAAVPSSHHFPGALSAMRREITIAPSETVA